MALSLNQYTYEIFKKDIMTFALKPGEPVSAAKIAERYEVSRTPAREALVKLQAEGLVKIYPQSKSVISKIDPNRVKQEWFVRRTLEIGMVDDFFDHVTSRDIQDMEQFAEKLEALDVNPRARETSYEYLSLDNAFHAVTYRVAGKYLAADIIANSMAHYNRVRLLIDLDSANRDRTVADHKGLTASVIEGDREKYRERLRKHLGYIVSDMMEAKQKMPDLFEEEA